MNLHFNKIQNDIYRSLVRIQDHAKSNNPLFSLGIAYYLMSTTESFTPVYQALDPIAQPFAQQNCAEMANPVK